MRLVLVIFSVRVSYEQHIVGFCLVWAVIIKKKMPENGWHIDKRNLFLKV